MQIKDKVTFDRIIACAKLEKELVGSIKISDEDLNGIQDFLNDKLKFATHFANKKNNMLLHEKDGKYQIVKSQILIKLYRHSLQFLMHCSFC